MTKPKKTSNKASKAKVPTKAKAAKAKEKTPTKATATPIKSSSSSSSQQTQQTQYTQQLPTKEEKASRNLWLNSIVNDLVEKRQESKNRLPHDTYTKIVKDFKAMCPWLTKDMLRSRVRRRIEKIEKERKNQALGISTGAISKLPVAGIPTVLHNPHKNQTLPQTQPKTNETTPSTAAFAAASTATATTTNPQDDHYLKQCMISAKNEIVLLYAQESKKSREWGLYKKIHDQVKETRNLPESFNFPYTTAKKRIRRQKLIVH